MCHSISTKKKAQSSCARDDHISPFSSKSHISSKNMASNLQDKVTKAAYIWCCVPHTNFNSAMALWCAGLDPSLILSESLQDEVRTRVKGLQSSIEVSGCMINIIERCKIIYCFAARVPKKIHTKGLPAADVLAKTEIGSKSLMDYCRLAGMPQHCLDTGKTKPDYVKVYRFKQEFDKDPSKIVTATSYQHSIKNPVTMLAPGVDAMHNAKEIVITSNDNASIASSLTITPQCSMESAFCFDDHEASTKNSTSTTSPTAQSSNTAKSTTSPTAQSSNTTKSTTPTAQPSKTTKPKNPSTEHSNKDSSFSKLTTIDQPRQTAK